MLEQLMVFLINIFCPPLSVMLIAGPGTDCLINTLLFIAGVLPGHIHGFYVSCTYFHRKGKVKKGWYPGGRKSFIYSKLVINGGASDERVRELWKEKCRAEESSTATRICWRKSGGSQVNDGVDRSWDGRRESKRASTRTSAPDAGRSLRTNHNGKLVTGAHSWRL